MKYNVPIRIKGTKRIGEVVGDKEYSNYTLYHVMFNHSLCNLEYFTKDQIIMVKDQKIINEYNAEIEEINKRSKEEHEKYIKETFDENGAYKQKFATAALPFLSGIGNSINWL